MPLAALNGRPNRLGVLLTNGLPASSPSGLFKVKAFVSRYSGAAFTNHSGGESGHARDFSRAIRGAVRG